MGSGAGKLQSLPTVTWTYRNEFWSVRIQILGIDCLMHLWNIYSILLIYSFDYVIYPIPILVLACLAYRLVIIIGWKQYVERLGIRNSDSRIVILLLRITWRIVLFNCVLGDNTKGTGKQKDRQNRLHQILKLLCIKWHQQQSKNATNRMRENISKEHNW